MIAFLAILYATATILWAVETYKDARADGLTIRAAVIDAARIALLWPVYDMAYALAGLTDLLRGRSK